MAYHDDEWGVPQHDDVRLFEKLCLEAFQSGLSWLTILRKRAAFRSAFAGFDPELVARFDDADVQRLLADAGIVRNRAKIEATIANARATLRAARRAGRAALVVRARPGDPAAADSFADVPPTTPESDRDGQGPAQARVPVRRPHHGLRADAGLRPGRRPPGRLLAGAPVSVR